MSRFARRTDTTHAPIRDALRKVYGAQAVFDTSRLGNDFPDLVVGIRGRTFLVEVKTPTRKDGGVSSSRISDGQRSLAETWPGDAVLVVTSAEQAVIELAAAASRISP